jgi:hypothetical protein
MMKKKTEAKMTDRKDKIK